MLEGGTILNINNLNLRIPLKFNCKTEDCIYVAQCKICSNAPSMDYKESTYFGQTVQEFHNRVSGHRSHFNDRTFEKSALSLHAWNFHKDCFNLSIYRLGVVKKVRAATLLDREESKYIDKFKTRSLGLNRYNVPG